MRNEKSTAQVGSTVKSTVKYYQRSYVKVFFKLKSNELNTNPTLKSVCMKIDNKKRERANLVVNTVFEYLHDT